MEKNCELVKVESEPHDVEEGEISDSASIEEISEEAFNIKQTPQPSLPPPPPPKNVSAANNSSNSGGGSGARVWTMRDLYKYQISSNTNYSGLYNLAWAQAVNNKPLGEVFVMMEDGSNDICKSDNDTSSAKIENKVVIDVDDDGEKEEGELEEGEIDLDCEFNKPAESESEAEGQVSERDDPERRKRVDLVMEELGNLNAADAQKSYDASCSRLETTAIKLQKMALEGPFTEKDNLVQLLLVAIQTLHSVFSSLTLRLKQQNKGILLRLLVQVTSLRPSLFSSLQLKEVEAIRLSLESFDNSLSENSDSESASLKTCGKEPGSAASGDQTGQNFHVQCSKPVRVDLRHKGLVLPLLDLHKDHDADSLPSPTRDLSATFPFDKGFILEHGLLKPEWPVPRQTLARENLILHPYETDAVKAVSSYQQKFGRGVSDNLPSPTPSEEGDNIGDIEVSDEVSSSVGHNFNPDVSSSVSWQTMLSSTASMDALAGSESRNVRIANPANNFRSHVLKSSSAKSRDPRLRLGNSNAGPRNLIRNIASTGSDESKSKFAGVMSSRKQKIDEEQLVLNGPALKRQKNELSGPGPPGITLPLVTAISTSQVEIPNQSLSVTSYPKPPLTSKTESLPAKSSSASSPLPYQSIIKDIAGNPSMWMSILKMEQLKSFGDNNSATQMPNSNSILGAAPSPTGLPPSPSVLGQTASVEEPGKGRMKPRDPRRILHNNAPQKGVTAVSDKPKMVGNLSAQKQEDVMEKDVPSSCAKPPDITTQFTNNLKNIADILSVSQACIPSPILPQSVSSQPLPGQQVGTEIKIVANESVNFRSGSNSTSEVATSAPPRPLNAPAWSDVEHYFDGFDDRQKAAIQRERARRLEEQNKLFSAGKLCLVLDLDHTLLNSAKFVEVDPQHDEMLRKKEEQDREKPQRHLFRFPHMGMWTKLRPGIWNFLEKASKLYELHLYTMGNKYYATEMAKLLDPKGELFSGRVISRGDDGEPFDSDDRAAPKTKDLEGVLGMESGVVIIDDSVRVWPHNKLNLIVVERYIYFPCSRRQFGLPGPSLLEIDHDERPEDGTLASCLTVIERIHRIFYAHDSLHEGDVRNILACEQRNILAGCCILFSRVFPVGEAKPHMHPLWQTAQQFGAVCTTKMEDKVTHVVANSLGTDKVNWALATGRFVVHPGWVEASTLLYRRANELDFVVKQP